MNPLHRLLQFSHDFAERRIKKRIPRDDNIVVSSPRVFRSRHPDRLPQAPLDPVPLHRIPDPLGDREAEPADIGIRPGRGSPRPRSQNQARPPALAPTLDEQIIPTFLEPHDLNRTHGLPASGPSGRQTFAPSRPPPCQDAPTAPCGAARPESVAPLAHESTGLVSAFHLESPSNLWWEAGRVGGVIRPSVAPAGRLVRVAPLIRMAQVQVN